MLTLEGLFNRGKYDEILKLTEENLDDIENVFWRVNALIRLDRFNDALGYLTSNQQLFEQNEWMVQYFRLLGQIQLFMLKLENGLQAIIKAQELNKPNKNKTEEAEILRFLGVYYYYTSNYDEAITFFKQSVALSREINYQFGIAIGTHNLGNYYLEAGMQLDIALDYLKQAIKEYEKIENPNYLITMNSSAAAYLLKGEFELALKYAELAKERALKIGSEKYPIILHLIAMIYTEKGEIEKAIELNKKSLDLLDENKVRERFMVTESIIDYYCSIGDRKEAYRFLTELEELSNRLKINRFELDLKYNKAIYLKASNRITDKSLAQIEFTEILANSKDIDTFCFTKSSLHVIELLIQEYLMYKEPEVLQEIIERMGKLYDFAQDNKMIATLIDTLALKSKFEFIQKNYDESKNYMEQALIMCEEKQLTGRLRQLEKEKEKLDLDILSSKNSGGGTLNDRVDKSAILEYLQIAQRQVKELYKPE